LLDVRSHKTGRDLHIRCTPNPNQRRGTDPCTRTPISNPLKTATGCDQGPSTKTICPYRPSSFRAQLGPADLARRPGRRKARAARTALPALLGASFSGPLVLRPTARGNHAAPRRAATDPRRRESGSRRVPWLTVGCAPAATTTKYESGFSDQGLVLPLAGPWCPQRSVPTTSYIRPGPQEPWSTDSTTAWQEDKQRYREEGEAARRLGKLRKSNPTQAGKTLRLPPKAVRSINGPPPGRCWASPRKKSRRKIVRCREARLRADFERLAQMPRPRRAAAGF